MRKLNIILISILAFYTSVCAQEYGFKKKDKFLNAGIGVNSFYNGGIPIGASFEAGITDEISVGGSFDYFSYRYRFFDEYRFSVMYIGARGAYHFNELLEIKNRKIDVYAGATLGFRLFRWSDGEVSEIGSAYGSGLFLGGFVGGRYFIGKNAGVFAELGAIGSTNARLGATFRF